VRQVSLPGPVWARIFIVPGGSAGRSAGESPAPEFRGGKARGGSSAARFAAADPACPRRRRGRCRYPGRVSPDLAGQGQFDGRRGPSGCSAPGIEAAAIAAGISRRASPSPARKQIASEPFPAARGIDLERSRPSETIGPTLISPSARGQAPRGRFAANKGRSPVLR
jgi:hypothetical protein